MQEVLWHFPTENRSSNPGQKNRPCDDIKKKKNLSFVNFIVPTNYNGEMKESKKLHKYFDLVRKRKKDMEHDSDTNYSWCT